MRILVTGGAGFIGSAVVRHLIAKTPHHVLNIDKLTYAASADSLAAVAQNPRYSFRVCDICDEALVAEALRDFRPDAIMHLAAETHVDRSIDEPTLFVEANIVGTTSLLEAARLYWRELDEQAKRSFRFHHVSTDEVFGALGAGDAPFSETTPYDPRSPYSASKAAADHLVRAWGHTYGLPVLLTNCTNNYGRYQFPEKLIPLTIVKALLGEEMPVYGTGENVRDWLHVEDHAEALVAVLERGRVSETYLIGGRAERRNIDVVNAVAALVDELAAPLASGKRRADLVTFVDDRPGHDFRYAMDISKIERELGWRPSRDFETGLRQTVAWFLENEAWWRPLLSRFGRERLGAPARRGHDAMRVLVFGSSGQIGSELRRAAWGREIELVAIDRKTGDFSQPAHLAAIVGREKPDAVVITAAYTAVDRAEADEDTARVVNAEAPGIIARAAAELSAPVVFFSTDYVFDGEKEGEYLEDDPPGPINAYGRTKLAGEDAVRAATARHLILRTSWVYSTNGANFLRTMLKLAATRKRIDVVADQYGCPTAAKDIAQAVARILPGLVRRDGPWGTFHLAGETATSWHGFAEAILEEAAIRGRKPPLLRGIMTADYPTPARRPRNSRLSSERSLRELGVRVRGFREAIPSVLDEVLAAEPQAAGGSRR